MLEHFDLVVVGAGPAGSSAAFTAAEQGISVLLLEEHPVVGIPVVCAEGISRSTIKGYLEIKSEWISHYLNGSIIRGPHDQEFKIEYPECGWVLNRQIFDSALAQMAIARGAVMKTSARAMTINNNEIIVNEAGEVKRYRYRFLIGADGMSSRVGTWFGIDTRLPLNEIEVCAQYLIEDIKIDAQYAHLIFGEKYAPGGYAWVFPKSNNSANIGLGISPLKAKKTAKHHLDEWVQKEFHDGKKTRETYGGVPAKTLSAFSGATFFLVGDAARFTDPLSGAGIANGIKSGVIAGRNVVLRLKGKKDYYKAEIEKEILGEIKFHHKLRKVYLKLADREMEDIMEIGKIIYEGKRINNIDIPYIVKEILKSSPRILKLAPKLLF